MRPTKTLIQWLTLGAYSVLAWLMQPLVKLRLKRRARIEPLYGEHLSERLGRYTVSRPEGLFVWIHAVSLGETRAAAILLPALRHAFAHMHLLLTHGTATGREAGEKLLQTGDVQVWQPWDTRGATQAFIQHFKPDLGLIMETEIWPNLLGAAASQGVKLVLVNARMNEQTYRRTQRLAWLSRPALQCLDAVLAQNDVDAMRLKACGANVQGVFGNLKFDVTPDPTLLNQAHGWKAAKPVALFASSREGEEIQLLNILQALPDAALDVVQWLIVPRHPQRFDEVEKLISNAGFAASRRSGWGGVPPPSANVAKTIWLGDSLGEMPLYYALSDIAILGGSFERLGGQNLIEGLACGCPFVVGPHTFNFEEATTLALCAGVACRADDLASAVHLALQACVNSEKLSAQKKAATAFVAANRGATEKTVAVLKNLLG